MKTVIRGIFFAVFLQSLMSLACANEILYVTDQLHLGLYANSDASGKRVATLESGAQLKVLEKNKSYTKVKNQTGQIGWVKTAFLISAKPAKLLLDDVEIEKQKLAQQLENSREKLEKLRTPSSVNTSALKQELEEKRLGLQQAQLRIDDLNRQLEMARTEVEWYHHVKRAANVLWWYLLGMVCLLLLGVFVGMHIVNNRLRKRFYGFKLG